MTVDRALRLIAGAFVTASVLLGIYSIRGSSGSPCSSA